ncbi:MAG: tRNA epoxyqueuosine(34) reductase QueG [Prevotellaceae bacterium]|jgi:epoxyqueuosine reductase|nr:tRNA epoxyqueuosine(34) reductase QueG [Prevotellaceae bacterium]
MEEIKTLTDKIKAEAFRLGFSACGTARVEFLENEAAILDKWLKQNYHAGMKYMENRREMRLNPAKLVEGAKSVVSLAYNYYSAKKQTSGAPIISKYAYGRDYHFVVKEKVYQLLNFIKHENRETEGRAFVDSAPILEKAWAQRAGTGWIGKNTCLIVDKKGSFHFLAELVLNIELNYDSPITSKCGDCTRCIDNCPAGALVEPYVLNAMKCISYLTIEHRDALPDTGKNLASRIFGCDICQDVCPHNIRFAKENTEPQFNPPAELLNKTAIEWQNLSEENFQKLFRHSAVKRTKYSGLKRNIVISD